MTVLSPDSEQLLAAAPPRPSRRAFSVAENRASLEAQAERFGDRDPSVTVTDTVLGDVPVRVYVPDDEYPRGVCVYAHGGGWALGSLETHDAMCSRVAAQSGCAVVSVDFRQPPEHPFPAALEDVVAVVRAIEDQPLAGVECGRISVAGDSAGGNLAAATALALHDDPRLAHVLLLLPTVDNRPHHYPSYQAYAEGHGMTADDMVWYFEQYAGADWGERDDERLAPMRSGHLHDLPATTIITAECDTLRDEGEAFGRRLVEAGVPVTMRRFVGTFHPFFLFHDHLAAARDCQAFMASELRHALRREDV
jgi:acetyl esterase